MSDTTTSGATPAAPMTIMQNIETFGHDALTGVERAATWLVGKVAAAETSLHTLEANDPLVAEAIAAGDAWAAAHGVPTTAIETAGEDVLALAKQFASGLSAAPPASLSPPSSQPPAAA